MAVILYYSTVQHLMPHNNGIPHVTKKVSPSLRQSGPSIISCGEPNFGFACSRITSLYNFYIHSHNSTIVYGVGTKNCRSTKSTYNISKARQM